MDSACCGRAGLPGSNAGLVPAPYPAPQGGGEEEVQRHAEETDLGLQLWLRFLDNHFMAVAYLNVVLSFTHCRLFLYLRILANSAMCRALQVIIYGHVLAFSKPSSRIFC